MTSGTVEDYVKNITDLPVLPEIAQKIIDLTDSPDPDVVQIATLIQQDPSITLKILKLINSGYYSLRKEVRSIHQAVVLLGLQQVRNLVVTMVTVNHFDDSPNNFIRLSDFWNHSLGVATIAQSLGTRFGHRNTGDLYLSGLLHDVGKIIIQQFYPQDMRRIVAVIFEASVPMVQAEMEVLGFTHAEIGACIAGKWNLPKRIQDAILYHHRCEEAPDPLFNALIEFADHITKGRLYAVFGDQHTDFVIDDLASWAIMTRHLEGTDVDLARLLLEMDDEIDKARELVEQART